MTKKKKRIIIFVSVILAVILISAVSVLSYFRTFVEKMNIREIGDHLYSADCSEYSYEMIESFLSKYELESGACSCFRNGSFVGRNFDWTYSDEVDIVVTTPHREGRYASVGVCSLHGLTAENLSSGKFRIEYSVLPFFTTDGINEMGVCVTCNVVPGVDIGFTSGKNNGLLRLPTAVLGRYVLDYASSVDEAIKLLKGIDPYSLPTDDYPLELHLMISDRSTTCVVEFVDNELVVIEDQNVCTNFYLCLDHYTPHCEGVERYEILDSGYRNVSSVQDSFGLLKEVWFSNAYDTDREDFWYSDFDEEELPDGTEIVYGIDASIFEPYKERIRSIFDNRTRDGSTWCTVHSCVYDLENLTLSIIPQESDELYEFSLVPVDLYD